MGLSSRATTSTEATTSDSGFAEKELFFSVLESSNKGTAEYRMAYKGVF